MPISSGAMNAFSRHVMSSILAFSPVGTPWKTRW